MKYRVAFAPEARADYRSLSARTRAEVRDAIIRHLLHQPTRLSRSGIKRLRGTRKPEYRLRVGDVRVFYDVRADEVEVLAIVEKSRPRNGLRGLENSMKRVALAEVKDHLSEYLNEAAEEEVVITRHGRPAGVLIGFADEDDWFDYRLENDPRFAARIAQARASVRAGKAIPWEDVQAESERDAAGFSVADRPAGHAARPRRR